jgi:hypothetical protein
MKLSVPGPVERRLHRPSIAVIGKDLPRPARRAIELLPALVERGACTEEESNRVLLEVVGAGREATLELNLSPNDIEGLLETDVDLGKKIIEEVRRCRPTS